MSSSSTPFQYPRGDLPGLYAHRAEMTAEEIAVLAEDALPGGGYVDLPFGKTRYNLFGPENGIPFVYVHGLRIPSGRYGTALNMLVDNGFRVLTYDLYGRGFSDAPDANYSDALYVAQLRLLLLHVVPQWTQFHAAGEGLGARILTGFATTYGTMLSSIFLVGPALFMQPGPMVPGAPPPPLAPVEQGSPRYEDQVAASQSVQIQLKHLPGFQRAIYSTLESWRLGDPETGRGGHLEITTISQQYPHIHVCAIWGTKDGVMRDIVEKIGKRVSRLELCPVEGQGREVGMSAPEVYVGKIVKVVQERKG